MYVACGITMRGRSAKQDRSVAAFKAGSGWSTVVEELPFATRHVQMMTSRNRLLFYSANDKQRDRIVIRTFEPDRSVIVPDWSFHR